MKLRLKKSVSSTEKTKVLYPPRPNNKILPSQIHTYDPNNWVAQRKFNGSRTVVNIKGDKVSFLNYGEPHKNWKPSQSIIDQFLSLNLKKDKEYWFDGELLYSKTKDPFYKNKIVLFDILQEGNYFFNSLNLMERYDLLKEVCRFPKELESKNKLALVVTEDIWLVEMFEDNFEKHFKEYLHLDEIEGLVLKKRNSVLNNAGNKKYSVSWQVRCRKPHKNYTF